MTNRFNTRLIKFLYISSYGSHTLWCLGDVTTEGAEGNGAGFYSCAQMSFVSPPPPLGRRSGLPGPPGRVPVLRGPWPPHARCPACERDSQGLRLAPRLSAPWPLSGRPAARRRGLSPLDESYFAPPCRSNHTALTIFVLQSPRDPLPRFYHFFIS